jgi:hypothetical protein
LGNTGISTAAGGTSNTTSSSGITWNKDYNVSAGVYLLYINGFTPSSEGFSFTLGGTAVLGCNYPTVLPVELLDLKAVYNNSTSTVDINWSTATETNSGSFTVERSKDALNFEFVDKQEAAGNSTNERKYTATDMQPYSGVSYYRLRQIDKNGEQRLYGPVAVETKKETSPFTVKPNPVTSKAVVEYYCNDNEQAILRVYNAEGVLVSESTFNCSLGQNSTSIDFERMTSGLYLITLSTPSTVYKTKIVK